MSATLSARVARGRVRRTALLLFSVIALLAVAALPSAAAAAGSEATATSGAQPTTQPNPKVPVYAYFYQWFDRGSWNRAKKDYPLAGRYSSDDAHVLRDQITLAKSVGVNGFLTSWKSTPTLNRRLTLLLSVAKDLRFDVGVVYEALDFRRKPQPITTVRADMLRLVRTWGPQLHTARFAKPVIVWTGTDQYPVRDVQAVRAALGGRAYLLAASKSVPDYERIAAAVDGEAYYWSSANPSAASTEQKLVELGAAVHNNHGIWIAPAASGFDGTTLGHARVVDRAQGQTLQHSLANAYRSIPDAVGVISWNEWSENTYIEPGELYGNQELDALREFLHGQPPPASQPTGLAGAGRGGWSGLRAFLLLSAITAAGVVILGVYAGRRPERGRRRRRRPPGRPERPRPMPAPAPPVARTDILTPRAPGR